MKYTIMLEISWLTICHLYSSNIINAEILNTDTVTSIFFMSAKTPILQYSIIIIRVYYRK